MYDVTCLSGLVGTIASVRPVASDGASATTKSAPGCNSAVMPVTPPPGPDKVTWNTRTLLPATSVVERGGAENVLVIGATVLQPSSALSDTRGLL